MKLIVQWLLFSCMVMLTAYVVPGIEAKSFFAAMIFAVIIGVLNLFIKPVISLITLPINFLTLGIFGLIVNALLLWLAGNITEGISIDGFLPALIGSVILSITGGIIFHPDKK